MVLLAGVDMKEKTRQMTAWFPIVYAAMAGVVESVRQLLEKAANPGVNMGLGEYSRVCKGVGD